LDEAEIGRYQRFHRADDRARFLTGAVIVRAAFAAELNTTPQRVRLDRACPDCQQPHGQVRLADGPPDAMKVSVSHSGARVVVAAGYGGGIGIDIERIEAARDHLILGRLVLRDDEQAELAQVQEADRAAAFTTSWVRKEAVVKALGRGLRVPLRDFAVGGPPAAVTGWPSRPDLPPRIHLVDLQCDDGYRAALATLDRPRPQVVPRDVARLLADAGLVGT
jgi:4'-phosphopantetheinyl transferase